MAWTDAARQAAALAKQHHVKTPALPGTAGAHQNSPDMKPIQHLKKGEFFKPHPESKQVYVKGHYDRGSRSFSATSAEDINKERFFKSGKKVHTGFTY